MLNRVNRRREKGDKRHEIEGWSLKPHSISVEGCSVWTDESSWRGESKESKKDFGNF